MSSRGTPLWFLGEMERNTYLWRKSLSLADADQFEFWVDLPLLVEKTLQKLLLDGSDNPLSNPLWSVDSYDPALRKGESAYLESILEEYLPLCAHLHAWCLACSHVEGGEDLPRVVLPGFRPRI